jgi:nitrogen-specific signal transduction histidine kinase
MQAHPLSSPAARITPSPSASLVPAYKAGSAVSPHPCLHSKSPILSALSASEASVLAADLSSAFAMSKGIPANATPNTCAPPSIAEGAGLAHDAGNLLGALGLYCDLLQAPGVLREEHQHYAVELRQLAERSATMIQRLLRPDLPSPAPQVATHCNPSVVLGEQAPLLAGVTAPSQVFVVVQPGLTHAPIPQETLERITLNLVKNAAQAIKKAHEKQLKETISPGCIRVSFQQVKQQLELRIEDNGPGLLPSTAAAILHPNKFPAGVARGLGHRIVHELVQNSGGQIAVRVRPGSGTTFTISWPLPVSRDLLDCDGQMAIERCSFSKDGFGARGTVTC